MRRRRRRSRDAIRRRIWHHSSEALHAEDRGSISSGDAYENRQTSSGETYSLEEYVYVQRNMILGCFAPCLRLVFKIQKLVDFIFVDNATRPCKVATSRIFCEVLL
ncbi:hypothetical protein BDA96_10G247700 [Sorghum bicolor]|uniref:Uncharacterized protein n=2 Tax=Sorghum bicolor TaxID=4558 RepID=A0A921Q6A1_SORBI|nr:hypothetical protein BDA96_10G247700 [Sorghum bicolor]OQU76692.1 hypothetical protein SORBI_3010G189432 [Sorghum bicolor]